MTRSYKTARQRAKFIAERHAEGDSVALIARQLGISQRRVQFIMDRFSVLANRPNTVRFSFHATRRRAEIVRSLAERAGVAPSTMIDRIVSTVVDDGPEHAAKRLGKLALPAGEEGGE